MGKTCYYVNGSIRPPDTSIFPSVTCMTPILPYESFEYIFSDRELPEFGKLQSPYAREINTWKFFHAENDGQVPFGFESISFDDSDWDLINVPSTWQTEGYGLPQNLLYDYPWELDRIAKRGYVGGDCALLCSDEYGPHSPEKGYNRNGSMNNRYRYEIRKIEKMVILLMSVVTARSISVVSTQQGTRSEFVPPSG